MAFTVVRFTIRELVALTTIELVFREHTIDNQGSLFSKG